MPQLSENINVSHLDLVFPESFQFKHGTHFGTPSIILTLNGSFW